MFKNSLELVNNMMQIMHYLNFYVQVPAACVLSLVLNLFKHFVCLGFLLFSVFFQSKFWVFSS